VIPLGAQHRCLEPLPPHSLQVVATPAIIAQVGVDDADAVAVGAGALELALNSAGLTPLAFANALRIGSSSPV
jgi:hypothetical protein